MITLQHKLKNSMAYLNNKKYAIAVSGGSDSLALLYLCAQNINKNSIVVHFDHNLRPESKQEANFVKQTAEKLGFTFIQQIWQNIPTSGNQYEQARKARYEFFAQVCKANNLQGVLVAHSKTDLAETLLMRLGKGASLKGVSIFEQGVEIFGVNVYRPLLNFTRQDLQDYLTEQNIDWVSDPHNDNLDKMRPRIRNILPKLDSIGISLTGMYNATKYFNQASQAIDYYKQKELGNFKKSDLGYYQTNKNYFYSLPIEMQVCLINHIITNFKLNDSHLPRRKNIIELLGRLNSTKVEPIDCIFVEIIDDNLFFYSNDETYKSKASLTLNQLDKKTRYTLVKKYNLKFLPVRIRNRVPVSKNSANLFIINLV